MHLARGTPDAARQGLAILIRGWVRGEPPGLIPTGGTSVLGALGYLNAGLELAEQVDAGLLPEPTAIFVALGSGGTVAGLLAGLRLGGLSSRVVAVLVTDILPPSHRRLLRLSRACLARWAPAARVTLSAQDLEIERGFVGGGYGAPTPEADAARRLLLDAEGIALETTYTAKCLAAMLRQAAARTSGEPLLFWDTFSSTEPSTAPSPLPSPEALPVPFHRFFAEATPRRANSGACPRRTGRFSLT
jgi:D-cysteine desulfhydrase